MPRPFRNALLPIPLLLVLGCSSAERPAGPAKDAGQGPTRISLQLAPQPVEFAGADGWKLHGTLFVPQFMPNDPRYARGAVICHPMLSKTRDTYVALAAALADNNLIVLPYDPRGHGQSTTGMDGKPRPGWKDHMENTKEDLAFWAGLVDDLAKVKEFLLTRKDVDPKRIAIVGASVGANAALAYAVKDPDLAAAVLLSPGEEYRGIATLENAGRLTHPLYVAMGEKDESSQTAPATIFERAAKLEAKDKVLKRFPGGEHGTDLLAKHPELTKDLTTWLTARLAKP